MKHRPRWPADMLQDPWFYVAAVPAMIVLGLSKGGFASIGILAVPILALVISPVQAAGITLPILILSDIVALGAYWRVFDKRTVQIVLPASMVGILIGWLTAAWVTEHQIRFVIGVIVVLYSLNYWFRHRLQPEPQGPNVAKGTFWGVIAGFTSFVSHAGGPPYQMYTATLRMEPRLFAGTTVLIFSIINAVKVIPYFFLGQFDTTNLLASAILLPISIPATFVGVWLIKRLEVKRFYDIVFGMIFLVGVYLVWEGLTEIF